MRKFLMEIKKIMKLIGNIKNVLRLLIYKWYKQFFNKMINLGDICSS